MSILAIEFDEIAQIVIFAAIAIAALIKRVLKDRSGGPVESPPVEEDEEENGEEREEERPEEHEPAPRRHEDPAPAPKGRHGPGRHPGPPHRPHPVPEQVTSHRAPGALGGLPARAAAEPRGRLTDFETTRLHFSGEQPTQTAAASVLRRPVEANGRALLFGRDLSPHDRVRSALLWREVLDPPPSLTESR